MADSTLDFLRSLSQDTAQPAPIPVPQEEQEDIQEDVQSTSTLDFLRNLPQPQTTTVTDVEEPEEVELSPENDSRYVEYYTSRMQPVPDSAVPYYEYEKDDRSRYEKVSEDFAALDQLSDAEVAEIGESIQSELMKSQGMREAGPIEFALSKLPPEALLFVGEYFSKASAFTVDSIETALEATKEVSPAAYSAISTAIAGGRYRKSDDAGKTAEQIADAFGSFSEFMETVPALGGLVGATQTTMRTANKTAKKAAKQAADEAREVAVANRYNPGGAELATREAAEQARETARIAAESQVELSTQLIKEFEAKTGKVISKETNGKLSIDPDLARQAGRDTAVAVTERDAGIQELFLGTDTITSPILDPDKFDGIVAVAAELKEMKPDAFNNNKPVIDNLLDLTVSQDMIGGQELIDMLNKYGLSFENYVLTVVGSGSDAGKVLNALSQIKRKKPQNLIDADEAAKKAREAGDFRKGVMRIENIRRGGLVSQVATAARNLTSGGIRAPMEGLANVMDNAIYATQKDGAVSGAAEIFSGENWRGSFSNMKYMFSRPDVAKGYSDLILERPELAKQFDAMYNNINEIQKLTGRGSGTGFDKVLSGMEDVVDTLNTPNRWQEYLIRRGQFFGELERLTKREYDIDLIDALNEGKLQDLLNDASSIRPEGAPSFIKLVDDSVAKALDVTYAKQPEVPIFRSTSSFITRNGLTVVVPFPRFMFNSMELMGQYAAGSSIPLTRKMTSLVTGGRVGGGPLTDKDRQRITRNLMGMAAVGAGYWYRSGENAPAEYNQIAVGAESQMDSTPTYPMAHFLYMGEATKRMMDGTFDDWFDAQEFVELFTGSNFRTGVGNSILEEVAQMADSTDLTSGEAAGRMVGRTFGNYLTTWAVPFAQIIDAERAAGVRGTEYKDASTDPSLDFWTTTGKELKRSFQQRGIGLGAAEEAELPDQVYPFYPEGKERVAPIAKFAGVALTNRPSEAGEYLMELGFDYRDFGSRSKVPSIKRFETNMLNGFMDTIVPIAQRQEERLREEYNSANDTVKDEFTVEEYVSNKLRPLIKEQLTKYKSKIREGAIAQGDDYAKAMTAYRRIGPAYRKAATTDFVERYGKSPDPLSSDDLKRLVEIAKAYKDAYGSN
jgi:hypothetical protein